MEEKEIKISMLQMSSVIGDVEANCKKVQNIIENTQDFCTDVLVLPEVWTVGWSCSHFQESAQDLKNALILQSLHFFC